MSSQTLKPEGSLTPDGSIVDYELDEQKNDSALRILWSKIMDDGPYKNPSTYRKVEALFLCWAKNSDDLATKEEVNRLKSVFEGRFHYHVQVEQLDNFIEQKLQVRINSIVAVFVEKHDAPNTLLIVYYAGHGRPGTSYGSLELFGATSLNDTKKRMDSLVWNKTEELLRQAGSDVLEIFDCCYAGTLGLTRGEHRLFEYLAATREMAATPVPGDNSFTAALIYALEALVEENEGGRFTTDQLLRKIQHDAPFFPKNQKPVLSDRASNTSAGRIILHPLNQNGSAQSTSKDANSLDLIKRQTLTLHFDFGERPPNDSIELLGRELNNIFDRKALGVNRIRWGSLDSVLYRAARSFQAASMRKRRISGVQQRPPVDSLLPVPGSNHQHVLDIRISPVLRDEEMNTVDSSMGFAPVSPQSNADSEDQISDPRKKRKLPS